MCNLSVSCCIFRSAAKITVGQSHDQSDGSVEREPGGQLQYVVAPGQAQNLRESGYQHECQQLQNGDGSVKYKEHSRMGERRLVQVCGKKEGSDSNHGHTGHKNIKNSAG